jgi:hypothetical protein
VPSLRGTGLLVGGVAVGVAIALGAGQLVGGADDPAATSAAEVAPMTLSERDLADIDGDRVRAGSGREAVEAFLDAERSGDTDRSFALLADPIRLDYGSAAAWAADPDAVPDVLGYEVESAPADEGGPSTVTTLTRYRSSLDSVAGLVPARARTDWAVVREDGGWAVDLEATSQSPLLPPDAQAVQAARAWVQTAQACEPGERAVQGSLRLAESLCAAPGGVQVADAAMPLAPQDAGLLQNGLGGDVNEWARQVEVSSPVALRAVLAPLDDAWVVVAVLEPPGSGG